MGYHSTVSGDVTFSNAAGPGTLPPRVLEELQASSAYNSVNFFFAVNPDGLTAVDESGTTYELIAELQRMLALLKRAQVSAYGTVLVEGSDRDDVWRVVIAGNDLREEHAIVKVEWPAGVASAAAAPEVKPHRGWLP